MKVILGDVTVSKLDAVNGYATGKLPVFGLKYELEVEIHTKSLEIKKLGHRDP